MVRNRAEAVKAAEETHHNTVGMCQQVTRGWFDAPSAGDVDNDRDADAVDGWKLEPAWARHIGDRRPPSGVPVSWGGGRNGHGHRAISVGNGMVRSTDAGGPGVVATVDLGWFERHWGVDYLGWSDTIDGVPIPKPPVPAPPAPTLVSEFLKGGPRYDLSLLDRAVANGRDGKVEDIRDEIVRQVQRLHGVKNSPRVTAFLKAFREERELRTGLLSLAIQNGRTGTVKDVRSRILLEIDHLPRR